MRRVFLLPFAVALVLSVAVQAGAGGGGSAGEFDLDPSSGRAGRQIDITASDESPTCQDVTAMGFFPRVNGTFPIAVTVTLWNRSKTVPLDTETDVISFSEPWSVVLTMPSGRPAGSYPVSAECEGQGQPLVEYNDQIFVLRAPAGPAEPVEGDVTLTG